MESENNVKYTYKDGDLANCSDVTTVEVDSSITPIEDYAFEYWISPWYIGLTRTITTIWEGSFKGCFSLTLAIL